jgi:colanic acid biosynthesis glycosyl transferase WcaI
MRFLIITQYFPPEPGAAQTRLGALSRELVRAGHEVDVITALPNYPAGRIWRDYRGSLQRTERHEGTTVRRLWLYSATGSGARRLVSYLSFTLTSLIAAAARRRRPDVVFVESPPLFLAITGWLVSRRWSVPLILNVSDLWPESLVALGLMRPGIGLRVAKSLERWAYSRSTAVTAVTEGIQRALANEKSVDTTLFLPNGADTDLYRPMGLDTALAARFDLPVDGRLVVYAGTIGFAHGAEVVIGAAHRLGKAGVTLALFGGGSEKELVALAAQRSGLTNLRFYDPVPEPVVARLYSIAVAGLVTLRDSPLQDGVRPAKMFSIMASAKPVIYAGRGEGADIVQRADAGLTVAPEDPAALAEAILWVLSNPERAATMGRNGRRYVEEHLRWDSLTDSWLRELEVLLARQKPARAR